MNLMVLVMISLSAAIRKENYVGDAYLMIKPA